jgi:hypothetical protein
MLAKCSCGCNNLKTNLQGPKHNVFFWFVPFEITSVCFRFSSVVALYINPPGREIKAQHLVFNLPSVHGYLQVQNIMYIMQKILSIQLN